MPKISKITLKFRRDLRYEKAFWKKKDEFFIQSEIKNLKQMQEFIQAWIERFKEIPGNPIILEIGGAGRPIINFFPTGEKYVLDPLLDFYEKKFPEFYKDAKLHKIKNKIKTEAENMPFNDNIFDLIIMLNVLDHTENPLKVIRQCYRVLRKEGIMVLSVDTFNFFWKIFRKISPFLGHRYYRLHPQTLSTEDIKQMLKKNHFRILNLFVTEEIINKLPASFKERLKVYLKYNFYRTHILAQK